MSDRLVRRFIAATDLFPNVEVPVLFSRSGLVLHPRISDPLQYTISAASAARAIAHFERLVDAEAAFQELEPLADWTKVSMENSAALGPAVQPILMRHHATRATKEPS